MWNKNVNFCLRFREGAFETEMTAMGWHRLGKIMRGREYLQRAEASPLRRAGATYSLTHCLDKIPSKRNLRNDGLILVHSWRVQSVITARAWNS